MLENTKDNGTRMSRTLRAHPVAIALIGAECGWLAISATGAGERIRRGAADAGTQAKLWTEQLRDKFRDMAAPPSTAHAADGAEAGTRAYAREKSHKARARAGVALSEGAIVRAPAPAKQGARESGADDHGGINHRLADARERLSEAVESHPVMTLALAVLAGAAIGLARPASVKMRDGEGQISPEAAAEIGYA